MQNNYDRAAWFYDSLSRLVFGKALVYIQQKILAHIPANSKVLIVGGGTGWILNEIAALHPTGLQITYVEISENMLHLAQKDYHGRNPVSFVQSAVEDFPITQPYDVIFTAFLFDNFAQDRIDTCLQKLDAGLRPGGLWLFADFHLDVAKPKFWHKYLLQSMLFFFRMLCKVEATRLIPMEPAFRSYGYTIATQYETYGRFIKGIVYRKPEGDP
ncbi:ubiquinone/menaquinone biosynthesis C-methylase UbiE [Dyadobacter jejuensis]|uniref:Ubiquinone/menaquinone biosynthesis C-methylase UbiE n=1 Tax=Dyadobacter jejuensis TaxID=1082580 RepID=A0A316AJV7_9BACT|nr:class I SAM-dependent methyltransferase [Dyadobacter jejuensis]PWJ57264.1 ubiquinone/menaquinone biosynthesis C-methylase UbiE [Dyadobacter jejuensis]